MVIRTRIRAVLNQLALFVGTAAAIAYFCYQAFNGEHGIQAQHQFDQQKQDLTNELVQLQDEHAVIDRRVSLLKTQAIDPDMLEEKSREILGLVSSNDVVVLLGK
jgi:cell division protein FtsB